MIKFEPKIQKEMLYIKYQVVLFGSYGEILPKPDNIKYFMEKFGEKELIPTTFQEIGPQGAINRFSLTNSDESWLIEFGSNRIDIFHTNKDVGITNFLNLSDFLNEANGIVKAIQEKFSKKHNRLSLVTRVLFDEMTSEEHDEVYRKLNNTISLYNENSIADWNSRTVSRINYEFDGLKETFNVISNVKRTKGNLIIKSEKTEVDRLELLFDINTFQGNSDYRFEAKQIAFFLKQAAQVEQDLNDKYVNLIKS